MCETDEKAAKALAIRAFLAAHKQLMIEASNGQGVDRHLLGLRAMLSEGEQHAVFSQDPLFARSMSFDLSTSNVSPGDLYDGLGFGPATGEGYGVNYSISKDSIRFCVTCYYDHADPRKADSFKNAICQSLCGVYQLLSMPLSKI